MFDWIKRLFGRTPPPMDDGGEQVFDAPTYEDALVQNAMRALQTGKPVYGEWDGEKLTNHVVKSKEK